MKAAKQRFAVFDVDGTIFRSSLLIQVVNKLIAEDVFPKGAAQVYEKEYERWVNREGEYQEYIDAVVQAFLKHVKGVHYGVLADAAEQVVAEQWKRVYRYTRDLLKELKAKKHYENPSERRRREQRVARSRQRRAARTHTR